MSESEQIGRCWRQVYECGGAPSQLRIADAIDRLAADVAAIKAKVDDIVPEDDGRFVPSELEWNELVDRKTAAIRERDEARAEVEKLKELRDVANRLYGAEQAKVERLRKELEQRQPAGNPPKTLGSSPAAPQPAAPPGVEVPAMSPATYGFDSPFSSGEYRAGYRQACLTHRAAMDRAGVAWKEVGNG